ncbi:putative T7SS-secreted protein [Actinomycetospora aeridis]|uniref:T7SS-secreted protein n=1 Tax=Actinomycetospora aeridis TaxID=3129231 RepID=A0ABU8N904_9PSEU
MAELGETADPVALVPGDPAAVRSVQVAMSRLGAALLGAGDGLRRIDTGDWQGEAADSFRRVFDPVPTQWTGTGEAFLQAADAVGDYLAVLEWAQGEAEIVAADWVGAQQQSAEPRAPEIPDPGVAGRAVAAERLQAIRAAVVEAGDRAAALVGRARDLAPPSPSVAHQLGGVLGDLAGGAWSELSSTGQFLWQINPTRFLVEPAAAVDGWENLATGVANAATNPTETIEQALNPREAATNPTRWAGEMLTGAGLSAIGGAGVAGRVERTVRAADALGPGTNEPNAETPPPLGRYNGLTATEHADEEGRQIGRRGSAKSMKFPVREVDSVSDIDEIFEALSEGGQVVHIAGGRTVVLLSDGTYLTYRETSSTPPHEPAVDINAGRDRQVRVHTPRREGG